METGAGRAIGFADEQYIAAGAQVAATAAEIFAASDMIIKVKEPQPVECRQLRRGQILYTYLHLAPDPEQTQGLIDSGATCIAYETVTDGRGGLPLLAPMSEVAGRMSIQAAAKALELSSGGSGMLLGGVPGVAPAHVTVIGGGVVGIHAARMALGLGAQVSILDRSLGRLREIDNDFGGRIRTLFSTHDAIEDELRIADAVIGAVLIPGAAAPKLVTREMIRLMKPGSVLVDVAIDQGGCAETSRADHARRPDLRGRRRDPLLRRQHARRRCPDLDPGTDQRHAGTCPGDRRPGRRAGHAAGWQPAQRSQCLRRQRHLRSRRPRPRPSLPASRGGAGRARLGKSRRWRHGEATPA